MSFRLKRPLLILILLLAVTSVAWAGDYKVIVSETEKPRPAVAEGKALIYVLRPTFLGFAVHFKLFANDKLIGITKGKTYFFYQADPGEINFMLKGSENTPKLTLTIVAGNTYYLQEEVRMGVIMARSKLEEITETEALPMFEKCNYVTFTEKGATEPTTAEQPIEPATTPATDPTTAPIPSETPTAPSTQTPTETPSSTSTTTPTQ